MAEQFAIFLDKKVARYFLSSLEDFVAIKFFRFQFETEFISHASLKLIKKKLKNILKIITDWYNFLSNPRSITSSILSQVTM